MPTLWGIVEPKGTVYSGSGFKVVREEEGIYVILFDQPFSSVPAVNATEVYPTIDDFNSNGGNTKDNAVLIAVGKDRCKLKTGNDGGDARDRYFCFTAIGA
jgi:hypothetical protein